MLIFVILRISVLRIPLTKTSKELKWRLIEDTRHGSRNSLCERIVIILGKLNRYSDFPEQRWRKEFKEFNKHRTDTDSW